MWDTEKKLSFSYEFVINLINDIFGSSNLCLLYIKIPRFLGWEPVAPQCQAQEEVIVQEKTKTTNFAR